MTCKSVQILKTSLKKRSPQINPVQTIKTVDNCLFLWESAWTIQKYADFKGFSFPEKPEEISFKLLLHISPTGKIVEAFRCITDRPSVDVDFIGWDIFKGEVLHP